MKKTYLLIFICFAFASLQATSQGLNSSFERRAVVDTGSGFTKLMIADIDLQTGHIAQVLLSTSFSVPYQASLAKSNDGGFDDSIRAQGLEVFQRIREIAQEHQVEKISAIATAAFRDATNGLALAEEITNLTGIPLKVITQQEEGKIAFFSALEASSSSTLEDLIVWDIGTGSLQMTTAAQDNSLIVFTGNMGSIPFRNYIIDVVQQNDSAVNNSPNPISEEDIKQADIYARGLARKAFPLIKEKIKASNGSIIGIGRLFYHSIRPLVTDGGVIGREDLRQYISSAMGKTDAELNNPFAHVDVSNCILVLAFMKALHIQEIHAVDSTTTRGMLIYPPLWENSLIPASS